MSDSADIPVTIDEAFLQGAPSTCRHDFKHPKLRQLPMSGSQIQWLEYLGHGHEGIVFKARIDNHDGAFAVKVVRHLPGLFFPQY